MNDAYKELPDENVANSLGRVRNGRCMIFFYLEPDCIMVETHLIYRDVETTLCVRIPT